MHPSALPGLVHQILTFRDSSRCHLKCNICNIDCDGKNYSWCWTPVNFVFLRIQDGVGSQSGLNKEFKHHEARHR